MCVIEFSKLYGYALYDELYLFFNMLSNNFCIIFNLLDFSFFFLKVVVLAHQPGPLARDLDLVQFFLPFLFVLNYEMILLKTRVTAAAGVFA